MRSSALCDPCEAPPTRAAPFPQPSGERARHFGFLAHDRAPDSSGTDASHPRRDGGRPDATAIAGSARNTDFPGDAAAGLAHGGPHASRRPRRTRQARCGARRRSIAPRWRRCHGAHRPLQTARRRRTPRPRRRPPTTGAGPGRSAACASSAWWPPSRSSRCTSWRRRCPITAGRRSSSRSWCSSRSSSAGSRAASGPRSPDSR